MKDPLEVAATPTFTEASLTAHKTADDAKKAETQALLDTVFTPAYSIQLVEKGGVYYIEVYRFRVFEGVVQMAVRSQPFWETVGALKDIGAIISAGRQA